jgi:hypothetical protein
MRLFNCGGGLKKCLTRLQGSWEIAAENARKSLRGRRWENVAAK